MGTGRRKKAVARVRLVPGDGKFIINKRNLEDYFGYETLKMVARSPLALTEMSDKYDVLVNVRGGGLPVRQVRFATALSRALIKADETLRPALKKAVFPHG